MAAKKKGLFGLTQYGDVTVGFAAGQPTATTAGADTAFRFAQRVHSMIIQNNTSAPLYANIDSAASQGTLAVAAGQTLILDWSCTVLHLWTTAATNVNGSASGAIFVIGAT